MIARVSEQAEDLGNIKFKDGNVAALSTLADRAGVSCSHYLTVKIVGYV